MWNILLPNGTAGEIRFFFFSGSVCFYTYHGQEIYTLKKGDKMDRNVFFYSNSVNMFLMSHVCAARGGMLRQTHVLLFSSYDIYPWQTSAWSCQYTLSMFTHTAQPNQHCRVRGGVSFNARGSHAEERAFEPRSR